MHRPYPWATVRTVLLALLACLPVAVVAQTLTVDNDVQTVSTLASGTTATLTGKAELHVTGTGDPIPSCTINLNSGDAFFFMENIKPSTVVSTFLSRVYVSGAAAVDGTNVRVVEYALGTVIVPHGLSFEPLQVFQGRYFTGPSRNLSCYTAYNATSLGTFSSTIRSFKLKRGYTATIATTEYGTGYSRNYVAQDGDIEVSVLPSTLDNAVVFVRVFPWRWIAKKGIAGNIAGPLNVGWNYDWNIDQNSTSDLEYVPIRAQRWWPGLGQDWKARGSSNLLGYNEPDSSSQSNIAVGDAVWSWDDLLGTGLRVGSPAPTDGGLSWLYSFVSQCDSGNKRVDYVAVHYYRSYSNPASPSGAATQFYNFLKGVYDTTKRPIWVTEWNNGANWTTDPDPSYAQQQATVAAMLDMLESTPFVERYSIYNWVEDVRRVEWDDGSLTDAGVTYRDHASKVGYMQQMPDSEVSAAATYTFDSDLSDASGNGNAAMAVGTPTLTSGKYGNAATFDGTNDYIQLPPRIGDSTDFTFCAWVKWTGTSSWQRIFDLGDGTSHYLFLSPKSSGGNLRFAINTGSGEQQLSTSALTTGTWTHVAVTISGSTGKLFVNGSLVATNSSMSYNPVDVVTKFNYLGRSQFTADPLFQGQLDDVRFYSSALSDSQISSIAAGTPPQFSASTLSKGTVAAGSAFSASVSSDASGGVASRTFALLGGPSWLSVSSSGTLSGTPADSDAGTNHFVVKVTDGYGSATTDVSVLVTSPVGLPSGTYSLNARHSGLALTTTSAGTADGTNVEQNTYTGATSQQWTLTQVGGGLYSITGVGSGKPLEVATASTADGANVDISSDIGVASQFFTLADVSGGYHRLTPSHSGKSLEVDSALTSTGANVDQWTFNDTTNQHWTLTPLSTTHGRLQSYNYPTRFVRHYSYQGRIDPTVSPDDDSRFDIIAGLSSSNGVSFRSANYPTRYLRVRSNGEVWLDVDDGTSAFRDSATWVRVPGLADSTMSSFQMWTDSSRYLRHYAYVLYAQTISGSTAQGDATFREVP